MDSLYTSPFPVLEGAIATIRAWCETQEHSQRFQDAHFLFVDAIAQALAKTHQTPSEHLESMLQMANETLPTESPARLLFEHFRDLVHQYSHS